MLTLLQIKINLYYIHLCIKQGELMPVIFDSGLLDFALNESQYIEVIHNLGACPQVIQFSGDLDGVIGFPTITGIGGVPMAGPYLEDATDSNKLKVYKPDIYLYSGKFRIRIME